MPTAPDRRGPGVLRAPIVAAAVLVPLAVLAVWMFVRYTVVSVPTDSMLPVVSPGDRLVVDRQAPAPKVGDVVVANVPEWTFGEPTTLVVKRVVATGGQKVTCCDEQGRVSVDGVPLAGSVGEPRLAASTSSRRGAGGPFAVQVPPGRLFLMGDNRPLSADSRAHLEQDDGTVGVDRVVGVVIGKLWPPASGIAALT